MDFLSKPFFARNILSNAILSFWKFPNIYRKTPVLESLFNKVARPSAFNLHKLPFCEQKNQNQKILLKSSINLQMTILG